MSETSLADPIEAHQPTPEEQESVLFTDDSIEEFIEHGLGVENYTQQGIREGGFQHWSDDESSMIEGAPLGDLKIIIQTKDRNVMVWQNEDPDTGEVQYLMTDSSFSLGENGEFEGWWSPIEPNENIQVSGITGEFEGDPAFEISHNASQGELAFRAIDGAPYASDLITPEPNYDRDQRKERELAEKQRREWEIEHGSLMRERSSLLREIDETRNAVEREYAEKDRAAQREALRTPETIAHGITRTKEWLDIVRREERTNIANRHGDVLKEFELHDADAETISEALRSNIPFRLAMRESFRVGIKALEAYAPADSDSFRHEGTTSVAEVRTPITIDKFMPPIRLSETGNKKKDQFGIEPDKPSYNMAAEYAVRMLEGSWDYRRIDNVPRTLNYGTLFGRTVYQPSIDVHRALATMELYGQIRAFDEQANDVEKIPAQRAA